MTLVQKWLFFQLFFLSNIGQENVFYVILKRKNTRIGYKNKMLKKRRRLDIIPKRLTHGFGQNIAIFPTFFQQLQTRKISFTIFQNEETLIRAIKTTSSKSRKIDIFPKGLTNVFGPKMAIFLSFFLKHYRPRKCLLRYSRTKKRLSKL